MNRTDLQNSGIYNDNAWEYKILHLKVENKSNKVANPYNDSKKLKGSLSPEFIKEQFPEQFLKDNDESFPDQINNLLNIFGKEGWQLISVEDLEGFILFIFIRKISNNKKSSIKLKDQIIEYKELFDAGLINDEEWKSLKKKTLNL